MSDILTEFYSELRLKDPGPGKINNSIWIFLCSIVWDRGLSVLQAINHDTMTESLAKVVLGFCVVFASVT
jgi:hypothetical protein